MRLTFSKYHGAGNDFIIVDDRQRFWSEILEQTQIEAICSRRYGVGADGFILVQPSEVVDFKMVYYNSDGRLSSMCGNGGRCIAAFAILNDIATQQGKFEAVDGIHHYEKKSVDIMKISMQDTGRPDVFGNDATINTGSPHYVSFVSQLPDTEIKTAAQRIRYAEPFEQDGINVNFVEIQNGGLSMRTYERGVEDETHSCGTGVTAAALTYMDRHIEVTSPVQVKTRGGVLYVYAERKHAGFQNVYLEGPVEHVYDGVLLL